MHGEGWVRVSSMSQQILFHVEQLMCAQGQHQPQQPPKIKKRARLNIDQMEAQAPRGKGVRLHRQRGLLQALTK